MVDGNETVERIMDFLNNPQVALYPPHKVPWHFSRCERAEPKYGMGIKGSVVWTYYYVTIDGMSEEDAAFMRRIYAIPAPFNATVAFPNNGVGWPPGTYMLVNCVAGDINWAPSSYTTLALPQDNAEQVARMTACIKETRYTSE